jgi:iron complex outermembrane receptor protein
MKKLLLILILFYNRANAQNDNGYDSTKILENIIVKAYENHRKLIDVPAAISIVNKYDLDRYNTTNIIPAINANPGVRMEERSPGSFRLSIRGSSLRSPFGVRNVKVYYNGIPFTDPGGNTYLNQLGFYNFESIEIIKGPAGSLYGAGTGGVLLIKNDAGKFVPGVSVAYTGGSFHFNNINLNVRFGTEDVQNKITFQQQTSDGYRAHTAMRRDVFTWDAVIKKNERATLESHFLFGDMYYQTPGALTKKEYDLNPRSARPHAGSFPGADEAKAAFYAKTILAGFSLEQKMSDHWKNVTSLYGAYSQNRNPNFRNYSRTSEPHFGGRTMFQFDKTFNETLVTFSTGGEFQQSFNAQRIYDNKNGEVDSLRTDDEIYNNQGFLFLQANAEFEKGLILTVGASVNRMGLHFSRLSPLPSVSEERTFKNEIAPRLAILKKIKPEISLYASVARGFSPPATGEVLPSINVFNTTLQAESGVDYEFGAKGRALNKKLYFDVNAFFYRLKNAIVQQRDASGGDYFENAGSANQYGLETLLTYEFINDPLQFVDHLFFRVADTWNNFHYNIFQKEGKDFSGNKIPGIASQTIAASLDINTKPGIYANATFFYSSRIALNDANTSYASPYSLLGFKIGYKPTSKNKFATEIFAGAENILDEKYSLGNDINAAGGRYFNAAARRNFYAGIILQFFNSKPHSNGF